MAMGLLYLRYTMLRYLSILLILINTNSAFAQQQRTIDTTSNILYVRPFSIHGATVDVNNAPIANATVELIYGWWENARIISRTTSNENGGFVFYPDKKLQLYLLYLKVEHPSYKTIKLKARPYTNNCGILFLTLNKKKEIRIDKLPLVDVNNPSNRTFTSDEIEKMPR